MGRVSGTRYLPQRRTTKRRLAQKKNQRAAVVTGLGSSCRSNCSRATRKYAVLSVLPTRTMTWFKNGVC